MMRSNMTLEVRGRPEAEGKRDKDVAPFRCALFGSSWHGWSWKLRSLPPCL